MACLPHEMTVKIVGQTEMPTILDVLKAVSERISEIAHEDRPTSGELFEAFQPIQSLIWLLELKQKVDKHADSDP